MLKEEATSTNIDEIAYARTVHSIKEALEQTLNGSMEMALLRQELASIEAPHKLIKRLKNCEESRTVAFAMIRLFRIKDKAEYEARSKSIVIASANNVAIGQSPWVDQSQTKEFMRLFKAKAWDRIASIEEYSTFIEDIEEANEDFQEDTNGINYNLICATRSAIYEAGRAANAIRGNGAPYIQLDEVILEALSKADVVPPIEARKGSVTIIKKNSGASFADKLAKRISKDLKLGDLVGTESTKPAEYTYRLTPVDSKITKWNDIS